MNIKEIATTAISLFGAAIFTDSLRYKFTDHPKTQVIFGTLNEWAGSLGFDGLFGHTGIFSQYVIGSAELVASGLLVVGLVPAFRRLNALGAVLAAAIMTGAVSFHLFTPLGIDPNNDGGGLFAAAATLLTGSLFLTYLRRKELGAMGADIFHALVPVPATLHTPSKTPLSVA
jgi:hypothetical protein